MPSSNADRTETEITASEVHTGSWFGSDVSIQNNIAVVGAYLEYEDENDGGTQVPDAGAVYVYVKTGGSWSFQQKLIPQLSDGTDDRVLNGQFGFPCSVSDATDTIAVGAWQNSTDLLGATRSGSNLGAVYIYTRSPGDISSNAWSIQQKIIDTGGATDDKFGAELDLDGDLVAIARDGGNGTRQQVFTWTRSGSTWTAEDNFLSSDNAIPDGFGLAISVQESNNTMILGSYNKTVNSQTSAGGVYVFTRSGSTWSEEQIIDVTDAGDSAVAGDWFGVSVSLTNDRIAVGAPYRNDGSVGRGTVYTFTRSGSTWSFEQKISPTNGNSGDNFGWSVDIDNNVYLSASSHNQDYDENDLNFVSNAGAVYLFEFDSTWTQTEKMVINGRSNNDNLGFRIEVSNNTVLSGVGDYPSGGAVEAAYLFQDEFLQGIYGSECSYRVRG